MSELLELTPYNFNLFCKLLLNFPYEFSPNQIFIGEEFFNPANKYNELWEVCGRKSSKTDRASALTLFQVYRVLNLKPTPHKYFGIPKGKPLYAVNIGTSRDEALKVAFGTIKGWSERIIDLSIRFSNSLTLPG